MTDVADIQPLMARAEDAAHRGDFPAAEEALRQAIELQERLLGPGSPEVASTLNNLGIVYERLDRPADAEACFRRSFAIAKAAFGQGHPLLETSEANLREFCDARGVRFEQPDPPPAAAAEPPAPAVPVPATAAPRVVEPPPRAPTPKPTVPRPPISEAPRPPASAPVAPTPAPSSRTPLFLGIAGVVAIAAVVVFWSRRAPSPEGPVPAPAPAAAPAPAPAVTAAPVQPPPTPPPAAATPAPAAPTAAPPKAPTAHAPPAPHPSAVKAVVEALDTRLCQALDINANWRCDAVNATITSGPIFFVTRLKSTRDTTVEHRWYRGDRLNQSVTLRVPGTGSGYRTYSRMTAGPDRAGKWRVELRAADGSVLEQKTFVIGPS